MITLETITEKTFKTVVDMRLSPPQSNYVAPNVVSLAQAWLYREEARPYAICADGEAVGFTMLDYDTGERSCGIWRFMIAPEHQHRGYGRAALLCVIDRAKNDENIDYLYLSYVPGNDMAQGLYGSLGFRPTGKIEDGEIEMILPLTDTPRVGMLCADEDDMEDLTAVLAACRAAGETTLTDTELASEVEAEHIWRFTVMGETVALATGDTFFVSPAFSAYKAEADEKWHSAKA